MAIIRRKENERGLSRGRQWDPFEVMQDMLNWDPFRELSRHWAGESSFAPSCEVKETKDAYIFKTDLPGIKEEELELSLTGNRLTISGERREETKNEGERYYAYERTYGSFSRSFTLPEGIDADNVQAKLEQGVLTVTVPKKPEAQPRRISLKGAEHTSARESMEQDTAGGRHAA